MGTTSPLKRQAIEIVIKEFRDKGIIKHHLQIFPHEVNQGLPITPFNKQTFLFARKRAHILYKKNKSEGDFFVGLESGLIKRYETWFEECWAVILNKNGEQFSAYSSGLSLPNHVVEKMDQGEKHHEIVNALAKDNNTFKGTWDIYTKGTILREKSIEEAFRNAFYYAIHSI